MASPADQYAAAKRRSSVAKSAVGVFAAGYAFDLDDFQLRACEAVERGESVLVAAPTGSGKTVVGEFAVDLALKQGRKAFYTTPIKALSNQKYHDLVSRHGAANVGLLTGDNTINGEAPIVVMTTEVLRNMIYAGSSTISGLAWVVMDEVHYLADRFRGAVWEEVIILLPDSVGVVALSATVSNAEEFGDWIATVRGDTEIVVEEKRPVPLWQQVMVGRRLFDLFTDDEHREVNSSLAREGDRMRREAEEAEPGAYRHRVNSEVIRIARDADRDEQFRRRPPSRGGRRPSGRSHLTPSRAEVVEVLNQHGLLPAIVFIFSRAGCDAAVEQVLASGIRLTDPAERREIREIALERTIDIPDADLAVLGYDSWLDALERGVASHHAGMLPVFKEVVEELFSEGLLKVVFATETLALGINMPARTVVLERLVKWNGETHAEITPGEYTQLTGRAGRRGIDVEGDAVVVWHNGLDPQMLAGLASTRTYPLRSSFAPSYNMAVNLVGSLGRSRAREVLETSFAQFQADRGVVGLARQLTRDEDVLEGYRQAMTCHLGDFEEYARLRRDLSDREKELVKEGAVRHRNDIGDSLAALNPGDVVIVPSGRRAGPAVVLDTGLDDGSEPRPLLMTLDRQVRRIAPAELTAPLTAIARVKIPKDFSARSAQSRRALATALRDKAAHAQGEAQGRPEKRRSGSGEDNQVLDLRAAIRRHPCHGCNEREDHARWAERFHRLDREISGSRRRIEERTNTIARQFDRVLALLGELGYVSGTGETLVRTDAGSLLSRIYTDQDLLAAESIRRGLWDHLDAPSLAAVAASLVYESRNSDDNEDPKVPNGPVRKALDDMLALSAELASLEKGHRLAFIRTPDLGFCWAIHRWTSGVKLERVLRDSELAAGDFVRWVKQVIDLLGQIAQASAGTPVQQRANEAIDAIMRGVVAYSSVA